MRYTDRGLSGAPLSERIQAARDIRDLDLDRWALEARALEDRVAQLEAKLEAQREARAAVVEALDVRIRQLDAAGCGTPLGERVPRCEDY